MQIISHIDTYKPIVNGTDLRERFSIRTRFHTLLKRKRQFGINLKQSLQHQFLPNRQHR